MLLPSIFFFFLFDDFFNDFPFYNDRDMKKAERKLYGHRAKNLMKTDIKEKGDSYILEMDLPGFKKDEIQVSLENGYLTIQASRKSNEDEKDQKGNYIRRERYAGTCSRSFYVGEDVQQNEIHAKFEDGILKLTVPKVDQKKVEEKKYISIEG